MIYEDIKRWEELSGNDLKFEVERDLTHLAQDLRRYVMAVLDPSLTFGVKGKLRTGRGQEDFGFGGFDLLDKLGRRELTGNAAKDALVQFCDLHNQSAVDLMNRALNKSLDCGVGTTLINSLGLDFRIPVFEVALAHPAEEKRLASGDWVWAPKYDGIRTLIKVDDNRVDFLTRSGKAIPKLQHLEKNVLEIFGGTRCMVDSEGVSASFLESVSKMRGKTVDEDSDVVLRCFDIVHLEDFYKHEGRKQPFGAPLGDRLMHLEHLFEDAVVEQRSAVDKVQMVVHNTLEEGVNSTKWEMAQKYFQQELDMGEEGIILRRITSQYTKARTYDWLKLKLEDPVDARILEVFEGKGKYAGMMGYVTVEIDGVINQIGGGWSDDDRAAAWKDPSLVIDRIIEIKFNGKMPSGALRHSRVKRFRDIDGEKA